MAAADKVRAARDKMISPPCHKELYFGHDVFGYTKISCCHQHENMERYWMVQVLFMDDLYSIDYDVTIAPDDWGTDDHLKNIGKLIHMMLTAAQVQVAKDQQANGIKFN